MIQVDDVTLELSSKSWQGGYMTETRWLEPDEAAAWIQVLALVEYLPGVLDQQLKRDSDLGRFEYSILAMLSDSPDRTLPMLDLSAATFGSLSRLSHTVTKLVDRGLVTRKREGGHRLVTLTDTGWSSLEAAAPGHVQEVRRRVFDHLPAGHAQELTELLQPIAEHLKSIAPRS
jgi:DNA-binding MarR family transcriptional regulator